jgi:methionine aminopeptidase
MNLEKDFAEAEADYERAQNAELRKQLLISNQQLDAERKRASDWQLKAMKSTQQLIAAQAENSMLRAEAWVGWHRFNDRGLEQHNANIRAEARKPLVELLERAQSMVFQFEHRVYHGKTDLADAIEHTLAKVKEGK